MTRNVSKLYSHYTVKEVSVQIVVTSIMTIFTLVTFVLLICFTKAAISKHPWDERFKMSGSTCTTDECYEQTTFLTNIINAHVKPCDDFYEYVCGNWPKRNKNQLYYPEWSVDSDMGERSFHYIRNILEEPITILDSEVIRKAKEFYTQCINLPHLGLYDNVIIASYVRGAGYFPMFRSLNLNSKKRPWTDIHNYYIGLTGESALFDIILLNPESRNYEPTLHLSDISSPYGLFITKEPFSVAKLKTYAKFLTAVLNNVIIQKINWKSYSLIEKDLLDVLAFRRALHMIKLEYFTKDKRNKLMTISELETWFHAMGKNYKPSTRFSWFDIFRCLYRKSYTLEKRKAVVVNIQNRIYFRLLMRLLDETPEEVIVNHIHLYFIERHLIMNKHLRDMMMDVITENGKLLGVIRYIGIRWHTCIAINSIKDQVGHIYVTRYFPAKTKDKAEHLVRELKAMMEMVISDSTWLNDYTKQKSNRLISDMKTTVGYPEYYDDHSKKIEFLERTIEPGKIDAIYSPNSNRISISAGFLNPPLFSTELPPAVIYGATGMNVGHEMYHAFGPDYIQRLEAEYCWPQNMLQVYRKKIECFVRQFEGVPVKELKDIKPVPLINGSTTIDENIADTMGLKLAYETFKRTLWISRDCASLPNLPDINCLKLFFISFAMSFCSSLTPDVMMEYVEMGIYSSPRLRVNGAVSNMKEFAEIFKCPANAPMNPQKKCHLWM